MPRRMTPDEYRRAVEKHNREVRDHNRKVEAAARERQRAVDKYNREARAHNSKVEAAERDRIRAIEKYNRDARDHNKKVVNAVESYNREVRQYNFKVSSHNRDVVNQRRRVQDEMRRLNSRAAIVSVPYRQSVQDLTVSYEAVEESYGRRDVLTDTEGRIRNWVSSEAANSAYLTNALEGDTALDDDTTAEDLVAPSAVVEMLSFSGDLVQRWRGALFALNPANPDAARHFCTSAREVLTTMLESAAPDESVLVADPGCERTKDGIPTRRSKVSYLLSRKSVVDTSISSFVEADLDNVVKLFRMFNEGTHGHAGRFSIPQLAALRTRVESAITFVHDLTVTE